MISSSLTERERVYSAESDKVLFDSGANCCITNHKDDFTGQFETISANSIVDGIGKGLTIKGKGTVAWTFKASNGMYRTLRLPCCYVPTSNMRIASTQVILKAYPKENLNLNRSEMVISGAGQIPPIRIPYSPTSNLPLAEVHNECPQVYSGNKDEDENPLEHSQTPSLMVKSNINLSEPEKEILRWHQ